MFYRSRMCRLAAPALWFALDQLACTFPSASLQPAFICFVGTQPGLSDGERSFGYAQSLDDLQVRALGRAPDEGVAADAGKQVLPCLPSSLLFLTELRSPF